MTIPTTCDELVEALREMADEHHAAAEDMTGRIAIGERALHRTFSRRLLALLPPTPEPIKVGDRVRYGASEIGEVLAVDDDEAWIRWPRFGNRTVNILADLTRVTDEQSEPEPTPTWRESTDPEELAAAVTEGKRVEVEYPVDVWEPTVQSTAEKFAVSITSGLRYRIQDGAS